MYIQHRHPSMECSNASCGTNAKSIQEESLVVWQSKTYLQASDTKHVRAPPLALSACQSLLLGYTVSLSEMNN